MSGAPSGPRARVAVIAVPGVGDERPGDTVEDLSGALIASRAAVAGKRDRVLVPVGPERTPHPVERGRLRRSDGVALDVYEMSWADLSRFPAGLIAFFRTAIGLALQLTTIGLESVRPLEQRPEVRRARGTLEVVLGLGNLASWCLATLALGSLVLAGGLAAALWIAVGLSGTPWLPLAGLVALGAALAVLGVAIAIRRGGWPGTVPVLVAFAAAAIAAVIVLVTDDGPAVGLANALLGVVAYPVRLFWLATIATVAATCGALAVLWWRSPTSRPGVISALATYALAPLLVVLIAGGAASAAGALAISSVGDSSWGDDVTRLRCLPSSTTWSLERCGADDPEQRARIVLAADLHRLSDRAGGRADELLTVDPLAAADAEARSDLLDERARAAEESAGVSPGAWARTLFGNVAGAMLGGVAMAVVALIGLLAAFGPHALARVRMRLERNAPEERRRARLAEVGATLGQGLARVEGPWAAGILAGGAVVAALWAILWWSALDVALLPGPWASALSILVVALLAGLRLVPRGPDGGSGALAPLRRVLDLPYDIANYLRLGGSGHGGRRRAMLVRYRAILRAVAETRHPDGSTGYDAIVLAGHSQGSVLTAAMLYGDPARVEPEPPLEDADPGTAARLAGCAVSILTFGSPIAQLYDRRLPGQYSRLRLLPTRPARELAPLTGEWSNLYRPGDYVGRAIWADPLAPASSIPGAEAYSVQVPDGPRFRDQCLALPGGHVGYWGDPVLARHLSEIAGRALASRRPERRPD